MAIGGMDLALFALPSPPTPCPFDFLSLPPGAQVRSESSSRGGRLFQETPGGGGCGQVEIGGWREGEVKVSRPFLAGAEIQEGLPVLQGPDFHGAGLLGFQLPLDPGPWGQHHPPHTHTPPPGTFPPASLWVPPPYSKGSLTAPPAPFLMLPSVSVFPVGAD